MNLKLRHRSDIVHARARDFPDEDWGHGSPRNQLREKWALCGAAGANSKLYPTDLPVTCKSCLSIKRKIENGTHRFCR